MNRITGLGLCFYISKMGTLTSSEAGYKQSISEEIYIYIYAMENLDTFASLLFNRCLFSPISVYWVNT